MCASPNRQMATTSSRPASRTTGSTVDTTAGYIKPVADPPDEPGRRAFGTAAGRSRV
jgi:hypothetical protein